MLVKYFDEYGDIAVEQVQHIEYDSESSCLVFYGDSDEVIIKDNISKPFAEAYIDEMFEKGKVDITSLGNCYYDD